MYTPVSCRVMLRHVTSRHVMSRHVMSCHVMSGGCHVISRHVIHLQMQINVQVHESNQHHFARLKLAVPNNTSHKHVVAMTHAFVFVTSRFATSRPRKLRANRHIACENGMHFIQASVAPIVAHSVIDPRFIEPDVLPSLPLLSHRFPKANGPMLRVVQPSCTLQASVRCPNNQR